MALEISYREKRTSYDGMKGIQFFEPDMKLLRKEGPNHELCKRKYLNPEKHQPEALWALLDLVSKDDIVKYRREYFKAEAKKKLEKIVKGAAKLTAKIHDAKTIEEADALVIAVKDLLDPFPEDFKKLPFGLAESAHNKKVEELTVDPEEGKKRKKQEEAEFKIRTENTLLTIDLEKLNQQDLAKITRDLKLKPKDFKGATLLPLLTIHKANLLAELNDPKNDKTKEQLPTAGNKEKEGAGSGEPNEEVKGDPEKGNEVLQENEELKEENEELKSDLENKEEENEELEEQVDELKDELEEQKKSDTPEA